MKIMLKNLGPIRQAELTLGDLTIICGNNNSGKTYATYALFGFLDTWREHLNVEIEKNTIDTLLRDGVVHIDLNKYDKKAVSILKKGCKSFSKSLSDVFSSSPEHFKETQFQASLTKRETLPAASYERIMRVRASNSEVFSLYKADNSMELIVTLLVEKDEVKFPNQMIRRVIADSMNEIIFSHYLPNPFISSAERTGAAIFRKELNFARNRLLDEMSHADKKFDPMDLLFKVYQDYALPVERNVDFARQLEKVAKETSFIAEEHPELLDDLTDIIGGEYSVTRNDELYFKPKGKRIKLTMDESSSAVRSLLDIGFYLRHVVKPGDLLMVDEPELNLHPENQRRIARLFARLINLGIKVFITTHSDYIIKELNTLIMLNQKKPHLQEIIKEEGYNTDELISVDRIKVYIAEEALILQEGKQRRTRCQTLTDVKIDREQGIEARSFDATIDAMNKIQEAIIWGGD